MTYKWRIVCILTLFDVLLVFLLALKLHAPTPALPKVRSIPSSTPANSLDSHGRVL